MYHYVRNNELFKYDTYCRRTDEFYSQIEFFRKHSSIVDPNDIEKLHFYLSSKEEEAYLLTFDDGYYDHYACAKYLSSNNLSALFFPPIDIFRNKILDVNLIHMILGNRFYLSKEILEKVISKIKDYGFQISYKGSVLSIENYIKFLKEDVPDSKSDLIIKRLLQRDLLFDKDRKKLIRKLFYEIYNEKPNEFCSDLYLTETHIKEMKRMGMCFGSHGLNHIWMSSANEKLQKNEINLSFEYLEKELLISSDQFRVFCFPYGDYNKLTLNYLKENDVQLGFSTNSGKSQINEFNQSSKLVLKRWDTNIYWDNIYRKPCFQK